MSIINVEYIEDWLTGLSDKDRKRVFLALAYLDENGPSCPRPLVDHVKGSSLHNLKELRPSGTNIRILFVFDPTRKAIMLIGGDKTGKWKKWYADSIPVAEDRYRYHLAHL